MISFPNDYFENEIRDGFYVSSLMKTCWAAQLEVLKDVDYVCRKCGIKYFADNGSLLGAVRHGGFIPWDDDIDICMLRDDYRRFFEVAELELKKLWPQYEVIDCRSGFYEKKGRVLSSRTSDFTDEYTDKFHGFPFSAGLDIFPLDYVSPDPDEEELRRQLCESCWAVGESCNFMDVRGSGALEAIEEATGYIFTPDRPIKEQLYVLADALSSMCPSDGATAVVLMEYWVRNHDHKYPISLFEKTVMLPFECTEIPAPAGYDSVLKIEYGDYMRLVRTGGMHGYPYYYEDTLKLTEAFKERSPFYRVFNIEKFPKSAKPELVERILFVTYKPSAWPFFEPYWREVCASGDFEVKVMAIPFYDKYPLGELKCEHYDIGDYPDYVEVMDESFDIGGFKPDRIYVQYPYDSYDYTTIIEPRFFGKNLKQYTKEIVYIPPFVTEEYTDGEERAFRMMDDYVISPSVIYSDRVIVQSENIRRLYIKKLTEYFGEGSKGLWDTKIEVTHFIPESTFSIDTTSLVPEEWKTDKKKLLYYTSISGVFEHREKMIVKIRGVFDIVADNSKNITLFWFPDPLIDRTIASVDKTLYDEYMTLVREYNERKIGVLVEQSEFDTVLAYADAYYGDTSKYISYFRNRKLPVMIQNVDV